MRSKEKLEELINEIQQRILKLNENNPRFNWKEKANGKLHA